MIDSSLIDYLKAMQGRKVSVKLDPKLDIKQQKEDKVFTHNSHPELVDALLKWKKTLMYKPYKFGCLQFIDTWDFEKETNVSYMVFTIPQISHQNPEYYDNHLYRGLWKHTSPLLASTASAKEIYNAKNKGGKETVRFLGKDAWSSVDFEVNPILLEDYISFGKVMVWQLRADGTWMRIQSPTFVKGFINKFMSHNDILISTFLFRYGTVFDLDQVGKWVSAAPSSSGQVTFMTPSGSIPWWIPQEEPGLKPDVQFSIYQIAYINIELWESKFIKVGGTTQLSKGGYGPGANLIKGAGWFTYEIPKLDLWDEDEDVVEDFKKYLMEVLN